MSQQNDSSKNNPWLSVFNFRTFAVGGEVGCVTLIIVLGAVFGGLWLDGVLNTKPLITIILVIGSIPLSLFLTYWIAIRAVNRINNQMMEHRDPKDDNTKIQGDINK